MIERVVPDGAGFVDEHGCYFESKAHYLYTAVLPSCGCGDPASIGKYVKDMLIKYVMQSDNKNRDCWNFVNYNDLPVIFFLSWANREGYIEHGTAIRCSWMTEKGNELLIDLAVVESEE